MLAKHTINILMADDDEDDRYFFGKALKKLPMPTKLTTVDDGEQLIDYFTINKGMFPDILFLDINMPRKNGYECLIELKSNRDINDFPVVIYSTSLKDTMADMLFEKGAYYYLRKGDFDDLVKCLTMILTKVSEKNFSKPSKDEFLLNDVRVT